MPHSPFDISINEPAELKNETDNTILDDSDDSVAETSTIKSDEETDDWQTVAAKKSLHFANQDQEEP
ncbi:hypothetical protein IW148_006377 [Coemansia sp. RSA 1199]|nr:hypothetical protein IW148_006377 [Coemansia sp. RSA 1199]